MLSPSPWETATSPTVTSSHTISTTTRRRAQAPAILYRAPVTGGDHRTSLRSQGDPGGARQPRVPASRPRSDGPRVRASARRRRARPRRADVDRALLAAVPRGLRRDALRLPDDAPHRAGEGAAAPRRHVGHRGLPGGRMLRRSGPSARASPNWWARRRRPTGPAITARSRTCRAASPRTSPARAATEQDRRSAAARGSLVLRAHEPHSLQPASSSSMTPTLALAFYRDTLGLELRNDVARGDFRWITVGAAAQPGVAIVLTNYLNGSPADSDAVAAPGRQGRAERRPLPHRRPRRHLREAARLGRRDRAGADRAAVGDARLRRA